MSTPHVQTPENQPRMETLEHYERATTESHAEIMEHRPRPRTRPPTFSSAPPPRVFQPQGFVEAYLPPLFIGLMVLVFVGSAGYLLWSPSPQDDYDLAPEELRLLAEAERSQSAFPESRVSPGRATGTGLTSDARSGSAVLHVATTPSGALVSIDGEIAGVTPLRLRHLASGRHVVSLERPGFSAEDTLVHLDEDVPTTISMMLTSTAGEEDLLSDTPDDLSDAPDDASRAAPPASQPEAPPPPSPTSGSIGVRVSPAGVPVQLDGQTVGVAPLNLDDVPAGPHTLTFFLPGYETATVDVDVKPGARETVDVAMAAQTGALVVVVRPWGSIYVNGTLHARDTDVSAEVTLPPGRHQVRVEHPELGTEERTVEVQADRTTSAVFDLN